MTGFQPDPAAAASAAWQDPLGPKAGHWQRPCSEGSRSVFDPFLQQERHKPLETYSKDICLESVAGPVLCRALSSLVMAANL